MQSKIWNCEYCSHINQICVTKEEIPKSEMRDYVVEPSVSKNNFDKDEQVVFCIGINQYFQYFN